LQNANAELLREELVPSVAPVRDAAEAALGRRSVQLADRRVEDVVADVDDPLGEGGCAEARVEVRRDVLVSSSIV
jgi:hypothetical protein